MERIRLHTPPESEKEAANRRIEGKKYAIECLESISGETNEFIRGFWRALLRGVPDLKGDEFDVEKAIKKMEGNKPMTKEEAYIFEKTACFPIGPYASVEVSNVPKHHVLDWCERILPFAQELMRYRMSQSVRTKLNKGE